MQTVSKIAQQIVAREGGYSNDPDDPGGATNYGVTLGTLRRLGLDLTGDGQVTPEDLHALTPRNAEAIFIKHYYRAPGIDQLPGALQASVFDMYVNAGANAVKILQRLLRQFGQRVTVDGVIGPKTAAAARATYLAAPDYLVDAYGIARRNYYFRLADGRPRARKYVRSLAGGKGGWITRAEEFITPRYHMSAQDFSERVAKWG